MSLSFSSNYCRAAAVPAEKSTPARWMESKLRARLIGISYCMLLLQTALQTDAHAASKPNIVLIYSDDVGYGDISCQGALGISTPNIDTLAMQGIRFTNAHASASVCTPSRYALLTGHYAWRPPAPASAILNWDAKLTIDVNRPTVASLLQKAGYVTGITGKWHLGLCSGPASSVIDYNKELKPGPNEVGFTSAFFYPATNDRVPCVFIKDNWLYNADPQDLLTTGIQGSEPTALTNPELLICPPNDQTHVGTIVFGLEGKGLARIGFMNGAQKARWKDETLMDTLLTRSIAFIEENRNRPFFLYYAPQNIHAPRYANARFRGKSPCGYRGDAMQELDWAVGEIMATLDRLNLADSTIVIFSSDNGGVFSVGYVDSAAQKAAAVGHKCNGDFRGAKGSLYEGGVRVPFIVRWPGKVPAGSVSGVLVGQTDLLATCAAITGQAIPGGFVIDSRNMLPTLLSGGKDTVRSSLVVQQNGSVNLAIISGDWKLILVSGSADQLYNLRTDPAEATNVASSNAARVNQLKALLQSIKDQDPVMVHSPAISVKSRYTGMFCFPAGNRSIRIINDAIHADAPIVVYDVAGKVIYRSTIPVQSIRCEHGGIYFVKTRFEGSARIQKVVVE